MNENYLQGFTEKCAQYGLDSEILIKEAISAGRLLAVAGRSAQIPGWRRAVSRLTSVPGRSVDARLNRVMNNFSRNYQGASADEMVRGLRRGDNFEIAGAGLAPRANPGLGARGAAGYYKKVKAPVSDSAGGAAMSSVSAGGVQAPSRFMPVQNSRRSVFDTAHASEGMPGASRTPRPSALAEPSRVFTQPAAAAARAVAGAGPAMERGLAGLGRGVAGAGAGLRGVGAKAGRRLGAYQQGMSDWMAKQNPQMLARLGLGAGVADVGAGALYNQ
jgi:hypothetical protein